MKNLEVFLRFLCLKHKTVLSFRVGKLTLSLGSSQETKIEGRRKIFERESKGKRERKREERELRERDIERERERDVRDGERKSK